MSIRFSKYIDIVSGVVGSNQVADRLFCGRVFTPSTLVAPSSILQFTSAVDVLDFFGSGSEEYARAVKYFSYVSPTATVPKALQFARYNNVNTPFSIAGTPGTPVLADIQAITAGGIAIGGLDHNAQIVTVTDVDLSSATSLANAATLLQTALRAKNTIPELVNCTVTYNAANNSFTITGGSDAVFVDDSIYITGAGVVDAQDISSHFGFYNSTITQAVLAETPAESFSRVMTLNNNCGSCIFTNSSNLTQPQSGTDEDNDWAEVSLANAALDVQFIFHIECNSGSYGNASAVLIDNSGTCLNYVGTSTDYIAMLPMSIQDATNYATVNGATGYMYRQSGSYSPSVTTDALSDTLDADRVNYYGQTQYAGQNLSFYQRGVMCGGATAPIDLTIYANELWLKDQIATNLMNIQLSQPQIPANARGQGLMDGGIQAVITNALSNGVIMPNSALTITQKAYVTTETGDPTAWLQVQNSGWWFASSITSAVASSGVTEYTYNYTLIYRKDDVVKTVSGSNQLL